MTVTPPSRADIEAEIAAADERRVRGDRENRADAAATILRWLIGENDRVPIRAENPGELVGGFSDVIRSPKQIAAALTLATEGRDRVAAQARNLDTGQPIVSSPSKTPTTSTAWQQPSPGSSATGQKFPSPSRVLPS